MANVSITIARYRVVQEPSIVVGFGIHDKERMRGTVVEVAVPYAENIAQDAAIAAAWEIAKPKADAWLAQLGNTAVIGTSFQPPIPWP